MEAASKTDHLTALRIALLSAIYILLDKGSYEAKSRPHGDLKKFVHWLLLGFHPLTSAFDREGEFVGSSEGQLRIRRVTDSENGLYRVGIVEPNAPIVESTPEPTYEFDLCISFAGEDRRTVEALVRAIKRGWSEAKIFYDEFGKWNLWGQDLSSGLYDIYTRRSRRCLIVFSEIYLKKAWPRLELRAAYSRMVKEGTGYILPLLTDDSEPPKELETVSYVRLGETKIAEVGLRLADMIFKDGYRHWLYQNEAAELLSELLTFQIMTAEFRRGMIAAPPEDALARAILALIWGSQKTVIAVDRFWEYLVFEFEPLAKLFAADDVYLAIPPDGYVARYVSDQGPLRMPPGFWDPIFARAKADNPLFAENGPEEARPE